jgi:hypothetical protein
VLNEKIIESNIGLMIKKIITIGKHNKMAMEMTECPLLHHLNTKVNLGDPVTVQKPFSGAPRSR